MTITHSQCLAARALADLTRDALADLSGVDAEIIARFERRLDEPDPAVVSKLQRCLEDAGVVFLPEDAFGGLGVRLKFTASETRRIATLENEGGIVGQDDVP